MSRSLFSLFKCDARILNARRFQAAKAAGGAVFYTYRQLYLPNKGMFASLPADMKLGTFVEVRSAPLPHLFQCVCTVKAFV